MSFAVAINYAIVVASTIRPHSWKGPGYNAKPIWRISQSFLLIIVILVTFILTEAANQSRDFYRILGLPRTATVQQIKKQYRNLSKKVHPDNKSPNASIQEFINLRDAEEVLTNPKTRAIYDQYGEAGLDPNLNAQGGGFPGGGFPGGGFPGGGFPGGGFPGGGQFFRAGPGGGRHFVFTSSGGGDPFSAFFGGGGGGGFPFQFTEKEEQHREDLYPSGSSVLKLTSSNWDEEVEKREFVIIVNFYNPGCSHCVDFKDAYENIAKSFKDVIPIGAVHCGESHRICDQMDIETLPTLLLFGETGPIKFEGEMSEMSVKKWLNIHVPVGGTLLTLNNFESWLTSDPDFPRVIFFTDKSVVPVLIRAIFREFRGRVSMGIVLLGAPAGKKLQLEKFAHWNDKGSTSKPPTLPALLHITDLDRLTGEIIPTQSQSRTVLSLILTRIIAQKRAGQGAYASNKGTFRELSSRTYRSGLCSPTDGQVCILFLSPGPLSMNSSLYNAGQNLAHQFEKDPVKFYWIDSRKQKSFSAAFGFSPDLEGCDVAGLESCVNGEHQKSCQVLQRKQCFSVVAYRPKRKRFKILPSSFHFSSQDLAKQIELFVDSIINGGASLTEKLSIIPSFII